MNEQELARREAALREKEAELARREQALDAAEGTGRRSGLADAAGQTGAESKGQAVPQPGSPAQADAPGQQAGSAPGNAKERLYDRIHIPLWLLDTIIVGCIIAFFVVVAVGALKGRGLL